MARVSCSLLGIIVVVGATWLTAPDRVALAQDPVPPAANKETVFALLQVNIREEPEAFERTQTLLIKSRPNLKLALAGPEIARLDVLRKLPDPIAWLERDLRVDFKEVPYMSSRGEGNTTTVAELRAQAPRSFGLTISLRGDDGPAL